MKSHFQATDYTSLMNRQYGSPQEMSSNLSGRGGNSSDIKRIQFITDLEAWLDQQHQLLYRMEPQVKEQRMNGVYKVVATASKAFQMGEDVDISQLPMSPLSTHCPPLQGLIPGLSSTIQAFTFSVNSSQCPDTLQASTGGIYKAENSSTNQNTTTTDTSKPTQDGNTNQDSVNTTVAQLVAKVMAMSLPIAGESGKFPIQQYGDQESVAKILEQCLQMNIRSPDQVAYILATAWHESRLGKWMTESAWLSESSAERYAENNYGPNGRDPSWARKMGNTNAGDGGRYMGRGYVQLTWKNNYERMSKLLIQNGFTYTQDGVTFGNGQNGTKPIDLVANYRHVNKNKDLAAGLLVMGMDGGQFALNGGLDDYIPENQEATQGNFENARKIVNGSDKKKHIAEIALCLVGILRPENAWVDLFKK